LLFTSFLFIRESVPSRGDGGPEKENAVQALPPRVREQYLPHIPPPGLIFSSGKCRLAMDLLTDQSFFSRGKHSAVNLFHRQTILVGNIFLGKTSLEKHGLPLE
jgi:hypothetical protein